MSYKEIFLPALGTNSITRTVKGFYNPFQDALKPHLKHTLSSSHSEPTPNLL